MDERVNWHLKKELSVGHLISTILLTVIMVGGWLDVQKRLAALESHPAAPAHEVTERRLDLLSAKMTRVEAIDASMQIRLEDLHQEILRRLDRQDIKLDRIEDRLNQHDTKRAANG